MKLTFLGTGTSTGIPVIACQCNTCTSTNKKDKRLRASVFIEYGDTYILIDAGPDLRQQLLNNKIEKVSAILITHKHYDHIGGLDDVRPMGHTRVYGEENVLNSIRNCMPYCFEQNKYPGIPKIELIEITTQAFEIENMRIEPIRVMHANLPILGFRIGEMAYLTDVKTISSEELNKLKGLEVLVLNALRHTTHISHLTIAEAIELAQKIGAKKTYFTHLSHDMGLHDECNILLPEGMQIAYDELVINID